ncbi:unnamed protein product, partial [Mesorhabditis spiculigera]
MIWMPAAVLAVRYPADQPKPLGVVSIVFMLVVMGINLADILKNGPRIATPTGQQGVGEYSVEDFKQAALSNATAPAEYVAPVYDDSAALDDATADNSDDSDSSEFTYQ